MDNELFIENEIYTLTDEDGKESEFQLIGKALLDGETYVALFPLQDNEDGAYVILKMAEEEGECVFVSIEDDDEYDFVADAFIERLQDLYEIDEQ